MARLATQCLNLLSVDGTITIPTSLDRCEDQNVRCFLISEVERSIHILGIMMFPIRERYLRCWTIFIIILGAPSVMGSDQPLLLPWAVLYLTTGNQCFSPVEKNTCFRKQPTHMLSKLQERNIRNEVGPSLNVKWDIKQPCTFSFCLQLVMCWWLPRLCFHSSVKLHINKSKEKI